MNHQTLQIFQKYFVTSHSNHQLRQPAFDHGGFYTDFTTYTLNLVLLVIGTYVTADM